MEAVAASYGLAKASIQACWTIYELCEQWKAAPKEVFLLRDDLARAKEFFVGVQRGLESEEAGRGGSPPSEWSQHAASELRQLLLGGHRVILQVQAILDRLMDAKSPPKDAKPTELNNPSESKTEKAVRAALDEPTKDPVERIKKRRRLEWMLRTKKVTHLRSQLNEVIFRSCSTLVSLNVTLTTDMRGFLESDAITTRDHIESTVGNSTEVLTVQLNEGFSTMQSAQSVMLEQLGQTLEESRNEILSGLGASTGTAMDLLASHVDNRLHEVRVETINHIDYGIKHLALSQQAIIHRMGSLEKQLAVFGIPPQLRQADPLAVDKIRAAKGGQIRPDAVTSRDVDTACKVSCACRCHSVSQVKRWNLRAFDQRFGVLHVSYAGWFTKQKACNDYDCKGSRRKLPPLRLDYRIPLWAFQVVITLFPLSFPSPEPTLRVGRVEVPADSLNPNSIFRYILLGDEPGLKWLLSKRPTAINDVQTSSVGTVSPLDVASTSLQCIPLTKLLMAAGGDVWQKSESALSPIAAALEEWHKGTGEGLMYAQLFPLSLAMEEFEYSTLHKIVSGILTIDLAEYLKDPENRTDINKYGLNGFAPIHCAASAGDALSVRLLVEAGAEVDLSVIANDQESGRAALALALNGGHRETVELLLKAGASVHGKTRTRGWRIVHELLSGTYAPPEDPYHSRDPELLALLVEHGADINAESVFKITPMSLAVCFDRRCAVEWLLEHGADPNKGRPPLISAIMANSHYLVRLLLRYGARYDFVYLHKNVLNWLAEAADAETMAIFTALRMRGVDKRHRSNAGETPTETFEKRMGVKPEHATEFQRLMNSVSLDIVEVLDSEDMDSDDDDVFFDAAQEL